MTPPAARRRTQFIDAVIDDYAAVHSTSPDAYQLELQRITQEQTGAAAGMQIGDDQAVLMEMLVGGHGSYARGGDRHVHWLFGSGRGARPGSRRALAVL